MPPKTRGRRGRPWKRQVVVWPKGVFFWCLYCMYCSALLYSLIRYLRLIQYSRLYEYSTYSVTTWILHLVAACSLLPHQMAKRIEATLPRDLNYKPTFVQASSQLRERGRSSSAEHSEGGHNEPIQLPTLHLHDERRSSADLECIHLFFESSWFLATCSCNILAGIMKLTWYIGVSAFHLSRALEACAMANLLLDLDGRGCGRGRLGFPSTS